MDRPIPSVVDAEKAVLGAVLLEAAQWQEVSALAQCNFYLDAHRKIYGAMQRITAAGGDVTVPSLTIELSSAGELSTVGGPAYLASLVDGVVSGRRVSHHIRKIKQTDWLRRFGALGEVALSGGGASEVAEQAEQLLREVTSLEAGPMVVREWADIPEVLDLERKPVEWLVFGLMPAGGVTLLNAAPGVGKSFLSLALATAVTTGGEFLSRSTSVGAALLLDRENPLTVMQQRMHAMGLRPNKLLRVWGGWQEDGPPKIGDRRLLEFAKEFRPLMVFDSLIRFHEADENDASEMRVVMEGLRDLANAGATVLVLHHQAKAEGSRYRGSSDVLAGVDVALSLVQLEDGLLRLECFKHRYGAEFRETIRPDFVNGTFELTESPVLAEEAAQVELLAGYITSNPGASQRQVTEYAKAQGVGRPKATALLRQHEGRRWLVQAGDRNAKTYFPISETSERAVCSSYRAAAHMHTQFTDRALCTEQSLHTEQSKGVL